MIKILLKKELTVLTVFLVFFVLTSIIITLTANHYKNINREYCVLPENKTEFYQMNYHDRALVNSVKIIEEHNNKHNKSKQISIRMFFFNTSTRNSKIKYFNNFPRPRTLAVMRKTEITELWKRFNFKNGTILTSKNITLPLRVDWREKGIISAVRSQKTCGACWAYSTLGVIESMNAFKTGNLVELSTSQMLDCNNDDMNCNGGDTIRLLSWLLENKINIQQQSDYLLSGPKDKCVNNKQGIRVKDFSLNDFSDNEHLMLLYLAHHGPLITCVNSINWIYYKNGIIQQNCNDEYRDLNHAVEIIGYDMTGEVPYYIVKNSWGRSYGINGYLKIAIGNNLCGIAKRVSAVILD